MFLVGDTWCKRCNIRFKNEFFSKNKMAATEIDKKQEICMKAHNAEKN